MQFNTSLDGVVYGVSGTQDISLWLQNGATWTNKVYGTTEKDWYSNEVYKGATVDHFTGGTSKATAGHIFQQETKTLTFNDYSGYTNIYYAHTGNGESASDYAAGDTIITKAAEDSEVTLITGNNDIEMSNLDNVSAVLNALAGKLTYSAFANGENNLTGLVKIADGLTSSSKSLKVGKITFDSTGKGTYEKPDMSEKSSFTTSLTGDTEEDEAYLGNIDENGHYFFHDDSTINVTGTKVAAIHVKDNDVTIDADKDLTLISKSNSGDDNANNGGILLEKNRVAVINAKNIHIENTDVGRTDAIHVNGATSGTRSSLTINSNVDMKASFDKSTGKKGGFHVIGAYAQNGDLVINGDVTSHIEAGEGANVYYGAAHLYATSIWGDQKDDFQGGTVTVNGNVDLSGTAGGLFSNIGGAIVTVNGGGKIDVTADETTEDNGYAALRAEDGTVNMNVKLDSEGNAIEGLKNDVTISGNVAATVGAVNDVDIKGKMTTVNLALDTSKSTLHGALMNGFDRLTGTTGVTTDGGQFFNGAINLWLQNGAEWNNELVGTIVFYTDDKYGQAYQGSHAAKLVGGNSEANQGYIIQNDSEKLTIDDYSGYTTVFYSHTGNWDDLDDPETADGTEATHYANLGDITIKKAAADSHITLVTDNANIDTDNSETVGKVLNALAGKLFYNAYINGEKNLVGTVKIGDGLTASSFQKTYGTGDITFDETTGQGTYVAKKPDTPDTPPKTDFTTGITADGKNDEYGDSGNREDAGKYKFTEDSTVTVKGTNAISAEGDDIEGASLTIDATGKDLTLATDQRGIYGKYGDITVTAANLNVTADGGNNRDASLVYNYRGTVTVNGNVAGTVNGNNIGKNNVASGLYATGDAMNAANTVINGDFTATKEDGYGITGKSNVSGISASGKATITVNGNVDMTVDGTGIYAEKNGTVNVNGLKLSVSGTNAALNGNGGTINVNMKADKTAAAGKDVSITGNVNGNVNLGMNTSASQLTGSINGNTNLWLSNGATWVLTGDSVVAKLVGGSAAGVASYDAEPDVGNITAGAGALTINDYSGVTNIFYAHEGNGESVNDYTDGNTTIKTAAENSVVNLITDNTNVNRDSKDSVANVLNALASKLFYSDATKGKTDLKGFVRIADGLTASSISQYFETGDITFDSTTGQGSYVKPEEPVQTEFTSQIQGTVDRDTEYVKAGVTTGDQKYTFKKDSSITVGAKDAIIAVAEIDPDWETTFSKSYKGITVDAGDNTLTLTTGMRGIYANGNSKKDIVSNITAGKIIITSNETNAYKDAALAVATGGATLNINADVEGTVYGNNASSYGLYAEKGSTINLNGNLTSVKEDGYGIDGKNAIYGIRANDGTINVNGGVNMKVHGNAVSADKGTININMNEAKDAADANDVIISGNITASNGTVNIGLNTAASALTGTTSGNTNLWLANKATWDVTGNSSVAKLVGGTKDNEGYITAGAGSSITIDNYSGVTNIFYAHEDKGELAENYKAGNTTIKAAAEGSVVNMITNNDNINVDDAASVEKVLNALANKLYYTNYINGENNLDGYVKIADGLTASSYKKDLKSEKITFDKKTGQGSYEAPVQTEFTSQIQGTADRDTEYVKAGVTTGDQKYTFKKDSSITVGAKDAIIAVAEIDPDWETTFSKSYKGITVDAGDNTLTLTTGMRGIYANGNSKKDIVSNITAGKIIITSNETNAYKDAALAVATGGATLNINADVEGTVYGNNASSYGLYAEKGSTINLNGNLTSVKEDGYGIDGKNAIYGIRANDGTINVNGGVNMKVHGNAVSADKGTININMNEAKDAADANDVIISGNITASNGTVNIGLNTAASALTGTTSGNTNLWLANKATWDVTGNSSVAKLVGGTKDNEGYITAGAGSSITIDNYSGVTNIFYAHEDKGELAENYKAGNTTIKAAAEGSVVNMITNNDNINVDDAASVEKVLNALANKLYYTNYINGERNLDGYVKIADGLTASSYKRDLKSEEITFDEKTGQGSYQKPGPVIPDHQVTTSFKTTLTGDKDKDNEYLMGGVIASDGTYKFTEESDITAVPGMDVTKDLTIDATGKTLSVSTTGNNGTINVTNDGATKVDITAGKLVLNSTATTAGNSAGINAGKYTLTRKTVNVNGDVDITAINTEGTNNYVYGILANNADVTVNGKVTAKIDGGTAGGYNYGSVAGISATGGNNRGKVLAGNVTVNGDVDISGNGTGIYANGYGSVVTVNGGGKITVDDKTTAKRGYSAIRAEGGTVNMNVALKDGKATGGLGKDVVLEGNVAVTNGNSMAGVVSTVNLALDTKDSSVDGVIYNQFGLDGLSSWGSTYQGEINLWLQNGATWTNEVHGYTAPKGQWDTSAEFTGSLVNNFTGGANLANAGHIFQKDSNTLTIGNYSGYTNIYYAHEGNGEAAENYTAGDTIIKSAAEGSVVNMITDNTGINMDSEDSVKAALNALAGKLIYSDAVNGKTDLTGYVKIADGLTSSSKAMQTGDIDFSKTDGKGSYKDGTMDPGGFIPDHQVTTSFKTTLTGDKDKDKEYLMGGVIASDGTYKFTEESDITAVPGMDVTKDVTIDATGKTLSVSTTGNNGTINVTNDGATKVDITAGKLVLNSTATTAGNSAGINAGKYTLTRKTVNVNGDVDITAINTEGTNNYVYGILANNADVTVNGKVTAKIDGGTAGGYNYGSVAGISATGGNNRGKVLAGNVTVNGDVDISGNGTGIYANGYGSVVTVNGGGKITVDDKTTAKRGYSAIRAEGGTVNMNVALKDGKATGGLGKDVVLEGNVAATGGNNAAGVVTTINLALDTKDSSVDGVIYNQFGLDGKSFWGSTYQGEINLWLQNGATWTNEVHGYTAPKGQWDTEAEFTGSLVNNFTGGANLANAGNIFQKDSNTLTIGNYSGYTNIYYAHEGNGEAAENYTAGDTIIKSAATGSVISLITDNTGVDMDNEYSVGRVLNALAGKLTYSNFVNGENNLTGYVKIADGLTASSKAMQTGDISFDKDTGKGGLKDGSLKPGFDYPDDQQKDSYTQGITGDAETDYIYKQNGILKNDGSYTFTKNPTTITVKDGDAINAKSNITINNNQSKLTLTGDQAGIRADGHDVTVSGSVEIKGNNGVYADNGGMVSLKGTTKITSSDLDEGTAVSVVGEKNGKKSQVDILGSSAIDIDGTLDVDGGILNIDTTATSTINGDVTVDNGGVATINLRESKSSLTGNLSVDNNGKLTMYVLNGAKVTGDYAVTNGGDLTMYVKDGGYWTVTDAEEPDTQSLAREAATAGTFSLIGGAKQANAGTIDLTKRTKAFSITNYSGWENFKFAHDDKDQILGDGVSIENVTGDDAGIVLITDRSEKMDNAEAISNALNGMKDKVTVNGDVSLAGYLSSNLTASAVQATFKKDENKWDIKLPTIEEGGYESTIMKGVRSAATTSLHSWRDNMQDTYGAADLADEDGIFAKAYGGKTSSDVKQVKDSNSYWGAQVGYDKALSDGWHTGVAFDYRDGDSKYVSGGTGDNKLYSFGVYGVKKMADNSYFRVAAKVGRVENDFDVNNEYQTTRLHGEYKATAYGLTAEYGKTFESDVGYITPKAQLTWTRVGGKDYTGTANTGALMNISQDSYNSFVGRLGMEAGMKKAKGDFHLGVFLAHEFSGDINADYFANDGGLKNFRFDGKDTWAEVVLGGNYQLSKDVQLYGDFARDYKADFQKKWKLNAGVRIRF